jgi:hypothetical protein
MKPFLIIICCFSIQSSLAQWHVGGRAGITYSDYKSPTTFKSTPIQGKTVGLTAVKKLSYDFSLHVNLEYIEKGYHHLVCNTIYEKLQTTFVQIPLMLSYNIPVAEKLKFQIKLGGYGAYWVGGKYKSEGYNPSTTEFDFKRMEATRVDFGINGGAQIEYLLLNGNLFGIDLRYDLGLRDMESGVGSGKNTNKGWVAGLNYRFLLGK